MNDAELSPKSLSCRSRSEYAEILRPDGDVFCTVGYDILRYHQSSSDIQCILAIPDLIAACRAMARRDDCGENIAGEKLCPVCHNPDHKHDTECPVPLADAALAKLQAFFPVPPARDAGRRFVPSELILPSLEWREIVGPPLSKFRANLAAEEREWLNAWEFHDLASNQFDDSARSRMRYGHHVGWHDRWRS